MWLWWHNSSHHNYAPIIISSSFVLVFFLLFPIHPNACNSITYLVFRINFYSILLLYFTHCMQVRYQILMPVGKSCETNSFRVASGLASEKKTAEKKHKGKQKEYNESIKLFICGCFLPIEMLFWSCVSQVELSQVNIWAVRWNALFSLSYRWTRV